MRVDQIMSRPVHTCGPEDPASAVAATMDDYGVGCVVVADAEGHLEGLITDRDLCLAAYHTGLPLAALRARDAMAAHLATVRSADTVQHAEELMRLKQVHRLPVVDASDRVVGVLSIDDVAREAVLERSRRDREVSDEEVAFTLAAIARPRATGALAPAGAR